jgi:hypothetical protein
MCIEESLIGIKYIAVLVIIICLSQNIGLAIENILTAIAAAVFMLLFFYISVMFGKIHKKVFGD